MPQDLSTLDLISFRYGRWAPDIIVLTSVSDVNCSLMCSWDVSNGWILSSSRREFKWTVEPYPNSMITVTNHYFVILELYVTSSNGRHLNFPTNGRVVRPSKTASEFDWPLFGWTLLSETVEDVLVYGVGNSTSQYIRPFSLADIFSSVILFWCSALHQGLRGSLRVEGNCKQLKSLFLFWSNASYTS